MDFGESDRARDLRGLLQAFMDEHVHPAEPVYEQQLVDAGDPHAQPAVMEELKARARDLGLWNLFHPSEEWGAGLTNVDYAPLAEIMGRSPLGPRRVGGLRVHGGADATVALLSQAMLW